MQGKGKLVVGIVLIKDSKALLVRHTEKASQKAGTYGLPSGRPDENEDILDACVRELFEETGLVAKKSDLIRMPIVYFAEIERKDGKKTWILLLYRAEKFSGSLSADNETIPEWVEIDKLSSYNLLPNVKEAVLEAKSLSS